MEDEDEEDDEADVKPEPPPTEYIQALYPVIRCQ